MWCDFDYSLMEFVPPTKRSEDYFKSVFEEKGLNEIVKLHLAQVSAIDVTIAEVVRLDNL